MVETELKTKALKRHKPANILLEKFFSGNCTNEETEAVIAYLKSTNNLKEFPDYQEDTNALEMSDKDAERIYQNIWSAIGHSNKPNRFLFSVKRLKYVAVFIAFLLIPLTIYKTFFLKPRVKNPPDEPKAVLSLGDGSKVILEETASGVVTDKNGRKLAHHRKKTLFYDSSAGSGKTLMYHSISVPYGKRFELILSDNTRVLLNSGTALRYPENFIEGIPREVYLKGEAYFEVATDKSNPFIVNTNDICIKVLGTVFDVSSYPDDNLSHAVLVEGSVRVYHRENTENLRLLTPGYMAQWDKTKKRISVSPAAVESSISWIKGNLIFKDADFKTIIRKLERSYNVSIVNTYKELEKERFDASFHMDIESIDDVIRFISDIYPFTYRITKSGKIQIYSLEKK